MQVGWLCAVAVAVAHVTMATADGGDFREEVVVRPLEGGQVLAQFEFVSRVAVDGAAEADFVPAHVPRDIFQLMRSHSHPLHSFRIAFTQGRWRSDQWAIPHAPLAPTGVVLFAALRNNLSTTTTTTTATTTTTTTTTTTATWKRLTHALSGLFCASLNFIDRSRSTAPKTLATNTHLDVYYGSLPREAVCTENLTPWIKLLPCRSKAGVASLLNAYKLFDANYNSIGFEASTICSDESCTKRLLTIRQTLVAVLDPLRVYHKPSWDFERLFDRSLTSYCPLADQSHVIVDVDVSDEHKLSLAATKRIPLGVSKTKKPDSGRVWHVYDLQKMFSKPAGNQFHLFFNGSGTKSLFMRKLELWLGKETVPSLNVEIERFFTNYGEQRGGLAIQIRNDAEYSPLATYLDVFPWYMRIFIHTFRVYVNGKEDNKVDVVQKTFYQPAIDRERPSMLELELKLPPKSTVLIRFDFDKVLLRYTEYPPDANRGFDIGAGMLTLEGSDAIPYLCESVKQWNRDPFERTDTNHDHNSEPILRLFTSNLLLALPTPDFSMPYNVITLTSTILALFFGSVFNFLTKRFLPQTVDEAETPGGLRGVIVRIVRKVKNALKRMKRREK